MQRKSVITSVAAFAAGAVCAISAIPLLLSAKTAQAADDSEQGWKRVPVKSYLDKGKNVRYCETETANHTRAFFIVAPLNKDIDMQPVLNGRTCPTSESAAKEGALAAVNAGYFNLGGGSTSAGSSTCYVTINGQLVCTPKDNEALVKNPKLKPFLDKILDRSELRFITNAKGKILVRIQPHGQAVPQGFTLKHAIQAGPRLLPTVTAKEEAFLRTEPNGTVTDSIGCLKQAARTAFGITSDGKAIIVCTEGPSSEQKGEFASGLTLQQLSDFLKQLGCVDAINFDGGRSTTMSLKRAALDKEMQKLDDGSSAYVEVCGRRPETDVKTCLIIRDAQ